MSESRLDARVNLADGLKNVVKSEPVKEAAAPVKKYRTTTASRTSAVAPAQGAVLETRLLEDALTGAFRAGTRAPRFYPVVPVKTLHSAGTAETRTVRLCAPPVRPRHSNSYPPASRIFAVSGSRKPKTSSDYPSSSASRCRPPVILAFASAALSAAMPRSARRARPL